MTRACWSSSADPEYWIRIWIHACCSNLDTVFANSWSRLCWFRIQAYLNPDPGFAKYGPDFAESGFRYRYFLTEKSGRFTVEIFFLIIIIIKTSIKTSKLSGDALSPLVERGLFRVWKFYSFPFFRAPIWPSWLYKRISNTDPNPLDPLNLAIQSGKQCQA